MSTILHCLMGFVRHIFLMWFTPQIHLNLISRTSLENPKLPLSFFDKDLKDGQKPCSENIWWQPTSIQGWLPVPETSTPIFIVISESISTSTKTLAYDIQYVSDPHYLHLYMMVCPYHLQCSSRKMDPNILQVNVRRILERDMLELCIPGSQFMRNNSWLKMY